MQVLTPAFRSSWFSLPSFASYLKVIFIFSYNHLIFQTSFFLVFVFFFKFIWIWMLILIRLWYFSFCRIQFYKNFIRFFVWNVFVFFFNCTRPLVLNFIYFYSFPLFLFFLYHLLFWYSHLYLFFIVFLYPFLFIQHIFQSIIRPFNSFYFR